MESMTIGPMERRASHPLQFASLGAGTLHESLANTWFLRKSDGQALELYDRHFQGIAQVRDERSCTRPQSPTAPITRTCTTPIPLTCTHTHTHTHTTPIAITRTCAHPTSLTHAPPPPLTRTRTRMQGRVLDERSTAETSKIHHMTRGMGPQSLAHFRAVQRRVAETSAHEARLASEQSARRLQTLPVAGGRWGSKARGEAQPCIGGPAGALVIAAREGTPRPLSRASGAALPALPALPIAGKSQPRRSLATADTGRAALLLQLPAWRSAVRSASACD
jgi:hypothetical protein